MANKLWFLAKMAIGGAAAYGGMRLAEILDEQYHVGTKVRNRISKFRNRKENETK